MNSDSQQLIERLKALADPVRLRLVALCRVAECSVSELTQITGLSQPRVSQHLKQLIAAELLERFRDGHFVYHRVPEDGGDTVLRRQLLALLPEDGPEFQRDLDKLRKLRGTDDTGVHEVTDKDRLLHKALVELTVTEPLGKLIDVGCGQGRLLKLLASRAKQVVGVDIDPEARRMARAELFLAGLPNCSLRQGDMYSLPFEDEEFDTVILDDVLADADQPALAVAEASRLLKVGGRMLMLASIDDADPKTMKDDFASWAAMSGIRLAPPRSIPDTNPGWLLGVATR